MQEYSTVKEFKKQCSDILNVLQDILDILGENKVTVNFNTSGIATVNTPKPITVYRNQSFGELPIPYEPGYDFDGWFLNRWTDSSTGEYEYSNEVTNLTTVLQTGSITLYGKWSLSWIEVSLNANGGSVNPETIYVQYLREFGSARWGDGYLGRGIPTPVHPDKSLSCWVGVIDNTGEIAVIDNASILSVTDPLEISAMWTTKSYNLSYDVQDAGGYLADITDIPEGTMYSLYQWNEISSVVQNPGYTFLGWSRTPRARDIISFDLDGVQKMEIINNTKVYAIWDNEKYVIRYYDLNGRFSKEQTTKINVPDYLIPIEDLPGRFNGFNHWNSTPDTYADYCKFKNGDIIYNLTEVPNGIVELSASSNNVQGKVQSLTRNGTGQTTYEAGEYFTISGLTFTAFFEDSSQHNVTNSVRIYPRIAAEGMENFRVSFRYNTDTVFVDIPITVIPSNLNEQDQ